MFRRTAKDLGLDLVLSDIASFSLSTYGRNAVVRAIPISDESVYRRRQNLVANVMDSQIIAQTEGINAESFPDISSCFDFIVQNPTGCLEGPQIYDIGLFIRSAELLRRLFGLSQSETDSVEDIIPEIDGELVFLEQEIFSILESPGTVKKTYPTVKALIRKAESKRLERTKVASELMHGNPELMNGENAVLRDGRIVLPVKNDLHNRIDGYIQGASQSGVTLFMEPFRLVDINNEVTLALQEIELEIARLLGLLTSMVRKAEKKLRLLASQVAEADFLFSFASWARKNNCAKVLQQDEYSCNLIKARHPLLREKCVPIDLSIDSRCKAVVLTGPNAGGKTVTMKTVGLFALLNQICGYIPASDGSSLALFDRVFTDIGDDQSIENQLSTFSGHMKSIGFVLNSLTEKSLIILDELGSGTDPQEGASLARAIMEYCTERAALTITTSHHGVLKQYAYSSDRVINASMEFDEKTLQPTFRVLQGLPGESHAIDTAKRMKLPAEVIESAKKYLGKEAVKISSIISGLEIKRKEADEREAEILQRLNEVKTQQKELEVLQRKAKAFENDFRREQLREFDDFVSEARKNLELLVKELREGELTKEKTAKVKEEILKLERQKNVKEEELKKKEEELDNLDYEELVHSAENVNLKPGMDVLCGQYRREGTVIREESKGKWIVAIGPMKFTFKETELYIPQRTGKKAYFVFEGGSSMAKPKMNLDLRGYRLEQALEAIDDEIEACCVHGIKSFSVIHGYGDGILSAGIHKSLKMNKLVESYNFAHPDDGGQGKTYVFLK